MDKIEEGHGEIFPFCFKIEFHPMYPCHLYLKQHILFFSPIDVMNSVATFHYMTLS